MGDTLCDLLIGFPVLLLATVGTFTLLILLDYVVLSIGGAALRKFLYINACELDTTYWARAGRGFVWLFTLGFLSVVLWILGMIMYGLGHFVRH